MAAFTSAEIAKARIKSTVLNALDITKNLNASSPIQVSR